MKGLYKRFGKFTTWLIIVVIVEIWVFGISLAFDMLKGHNIFDLIPIWLSWLISKFVIKWLYKKTPLYKYEVATLREAESQEYSMGTD